MDNELTLILAISMSLLHPFAFTVVIVIGYVVDTCPARTEIAVGVPVIDREYEPFSSTGSLKVN